MLKIGRLKSVLKINRVHCLLLRKMHFNCTFLNDILSSVNFESTFCYPQIPPKNKRNNLIMAMLGQKNEFVCSFFGRIVGLKKPLRLCLTFKVVVSYIFSFYSTYSYFWYVIYMFEIWCQIHRPDTLHKFQVNFGVKFQIFVSEKKDGYFSTRKRIAKNDFKRQTITYQL